MNILVIGNGFDLAHGLPTSYKEFLKFVLESEDMCSRFQKNGLGAKESASAAAEIKEMIKDNFWINHFQKVSECGENWIDFEKEDSMALIRQQAGWRKRAEMLACLIPSDVRSVMDIGCGECLLKEFLPQNVRYYGLDYKQRYKDTIVCDINKDNLPKLDVDLDYLAGVIDYIHNIPQFIKQFKNAKYVIMSKARNERFIRLDDKIKDKGYMNFGISAYYISDLLTDMSQNGFFCKKMEWNYKERDEYYFLFINKDMM